MKNKVITILKGVFPNKRRWKSWAMPTRVAYISSSVAIISFVISQFNFSNKPDLIQNINNTEEKKIYINQEKDTFKNFEYSFKGRLSDLGKSVFEFETENLNKDLSIKLDYTGRYLKIIDNSDIVNFSGGFLIIEIEDCNLEIKNIAIPQLGPAPKSIMKQKVEKKFKTLVLEYKEFISNRTKACLKDFL